MRKACFLRVLLIAGAVLGISSGFNLEVLAQEAYEPDVQTTDPCWIGDPEIWGDYCWRVYAGTSTDCYGPYDPKKTCSQQTSSCQSCTQCCATIYSCNIGKGKNKDVAQAEKNACDGHCITDRCT